MITSDVLKIDLDMDTYLDVVMHLIERLRYLHYKKLFDVRNITNITAIKKKNVSVKVYLTKRLSVDHIIIFQLLLGSDWRKEAYSFMDYHINKLEYWNRSFTTKRYANGEYITAKQEDITDLILPIVLKKEWKLKKRL